MRDSVGVSAAVRVLAQETGDVHVDKKQNAGADEELPASKCVMLVPKSCLPPAPPIDAASPNRRRLAAEGRSAAGAVSGDG